MARTTGFAGCQVLLKQNVLLSVYPCTTSRFWHSDDKIYTMALKVGYNEVLVLFLTTGEIEKQKTE